MKFTSVPAGFASFREPLVYAFDAEGAPRDITFTIVDTESGATVGSKKLYSATKGEIDIAPYLRRAARCRMPDEIVGCAVVDTGGRIKVRVEAEGTASPVRTFIAAKVADDKLYTLLTTQYTRRTMAADEFDAIGYFAMPDAVVEIVIEAFGESYGRLTLTPPEGGQRAFAVTPRAFAATPSTMRVTIRVDDETADVIDYEIVDNLAGACRLAWFDRHGAPELYTFPVRRQTFVEAARDRIGEVSDRVRLRDRGLKLTSAYEPRAQAEAIAEIVASPEVCAACGSRLHRVSLSTDSAATLHGGEMNTVEVEIRTSEEEVGL